MYVFGVDIPVVEVIFAVGIVGIIVLIEITFVLILITYHMRNSRRLESKVGELVNTLASLNKSEIKELDRIQRIEGEEEGIVGRLRKIKVFQLKQQAVKKKAPVHELTPEQRKKMFKHIVKEKKKNKLLETVDNFLKGWKR